MRKKKNTQRNERNAPNYNILLISNGMMMLGIYVDMQYKWQHEIHIRKCYALMTKKATSCGEGAQNGNNKQITKKKPKRQRVNERTITNEKKKN